VCLGGADLVCKSLRMYSGLARSKRNIKKREREEEREGEGKRMRVGRSLKVELRLWTSGSLLPPPGAYREERGLRNLRQLDSLKLEVC